ncbi:uncharacterized protein CLAFUR5_09005 [Fulvia fulva]|uniref:Uncharacterized protein n=1 Tax=Passalora fulva TaxID=5499 RepID=A0A9Q8UTF8_PASFU|nr:uncharacterized protein CLAFUR5_09005 [Fulvia fulva]UJO21773.1 hypothetical protein CLAFUR5_09005 [Fulvia fulva]
MAHTTKDLPRAPHRRTIWPKLRSTSRAWHPQTQSRLVQLPGELRNMIYNLVLFSEPLDRNPVLRAHNRSSKAIEIRTMTRPPLAATCLQLQHECLSSFFHHGIFTYTIDLDFGYSFHHSISRETTSSGAADLTLRDVVVRHYALDFRKYPDGIMLFTGTHLLGAHVTAIPPRDGDEDEDMISLSWIHRLHDALLIWRVARQARKGW